MTETQTVLISGASSGIGLATASLLLQQGYRVIGISRRGQVEQLEHANFTALALDLDDLAQLETRLAKLVETHDIDAFVHAAGQGHFGSVEQFSLRQMESALRVNLTSAMVICRGLLPKLRRRGQGRLIFIGSESALAAGRKGAIYCATKFGLRGFCLSLREDCASDGIQVSLINPGMVRSPFFDELPFAPGAQPENAIAVTDVAQLVLQIMQSSADIVVDEINLSPRVKSIDFGNKS
jgi:short-subunit dehydrogenase